MPNLLAFGFHEANQGEYLAQYFLSAFGVSAPVLRQEDIGVDFFCSLAKVENKRMTFHSPYMVQHGAVGTKEFVYGDTIQTQESGVAKELTGSSRKNCLCSFASLIVRTRGLNCIPRAQCG